LYERWFVGGLVHRDYGPAETYNFEDGTMTQNWYQYDKLHREDDKPASIYANRKEWFWEGKRHRFGLPAVIYSDWNEDDEWWSNGVQYYPSLVRRSGLQFNIS